MFSMAAFLYVQVEQTNIPRQLCLNRVSRRTANVGVVAVACLAQRKEKKAPKKPHSSLSMNGFGMGFPIFSWL